MVAFVRNLLSENDFEGILVNFCCYEYGTNASEAVEKIFTRTLELCQLTKTAIFIATPRYEKTYLAVYYLLIGDTSQVCFFPDIYKNE